MKIECKDGNQYKAIEVRVGVSGIDVYTICHTSDRNTHRALSGTRTFRSRAIARRAWFANTLRRSNLFCV
jgi:pyruvate/2-oxoacid:ferredoxin oxidoreductase beta subunit